ncbi:DUF488 domain-containing protein [Ectothiorhodospiraceae bacterium WFHF3C12]|nr:DUF488 domain-containing protein [Ectothiorhodospiraceae bacterium WFHF3C12]
MGRASEASVRIKRIYEPASPADGTRILVDRVWPRGMRKDSAALDHWLRDLAPSTELRKWFGHDPERWPTFRQRYLEELQARQPAGLDELRACLRQSDVVTLVFASREEELNNAAALKQFIESGELDAQ